MTIGTLEWVQAAGIRCVRTMAQAALAVIGSESVMASIDWKQVLMTAILAGITSLLTSTAGLPEVKNCKDGES